MSNDKMTDDTIVATEFFRDLVRKPRRGNLKLYITRRKPQRLFQTMLAEGQRLAGLGLNVIVGLDGEYKSADFPGLHTIGAKELRFGDALYHEADYENILGQQPEVAIIDDLLHVNISKAGKEMRYHNIRDMLEHGISVITSAYVAGGDNLRQAVEYVGGKLPTVLDRWGDLPADEVVALVFAPKPSFHHAELSSPNVFGLE